MTRIAIYTRLSHDRDGTQTATARQEAACRTFAELQDWDVAEVFEDVDVSAYRDVPRPSYERLLVAIVRRQVDGVLVWRLDRLVRRSSEFERFWARCEAHGVHLASVTEPVDTSNAMGLAIVRILVTFAGLESSAKSVRLKAKETEMARAGRPPHGGRVFGLSANWSTIVEPEAELIREAARRVQQGEGLRTIARDWSSRGIASPRGVAWTTASLRRILLARRLAGDREHHGEVAAAGCFPAILDPVEAARVRVLLLDDSRRSGPGGRTYLLTGGLLRCGRCGCGLRGSRRSNGRRYGCPKPTGCGRVSIATARADAVITKAVFRRLRSGAWRWVDSTVPLPDERALLEEVQQAEASAKQLARDYYVEAKIGRAEFLSARGALAARVSETRRRLLPQWRAGILRGLTDPATLQAEWTDMSLDRRQAVIRAVVDHAVILPVGAARGGFDPSRIGLRWRGPMLAVPKAASPDPIRRNIAYPRAEVPAPPAG